MAQHKHSTDPDKIGIHRVKRGHASSTFRGSFDYKGYIQLRFRVDRFGKIDGATIIPKIEKDITVLLDGLRKQLPTYDIQLWPQRLINPADESNDENNTWYWVIGLPSMLPSDLSSYDQILHGWQEEVCHNISAKTSSSTDDIVEAKRVSRKVFFKQALLPADDDQSIVDVQRSGDTFKKVQGSNPQQIRQQFLQHAMGYSTTEVGDNSKPSAKLRPARDVLNRLRYDSKYDSADFVIGYIDRKAGILEKSVAAWEDFEPESHIAYFKHVSEDRIVWDRAKKIDLLFGLGN